MEEKINAVQNMIDYINDNLLEEITMADLSKVSFYSPWYSYRIFKELTQLSLADYIRRLRLSNSALELRDKNVKVIDIAFKYCFESVDGYQRAFRKEFACNPYEYSKNPIPICIFKSYGVKFKTQKGEKIMKEIRNVFIQQIEKPERKVIIKRGKTADNYFAYCEEVGCDIWGILTSIKSISGEPVCLWLPEKLIKPNTSKYVQGVEVSLDYNGVIPDGFEVITLPKAQYLMFQGEEFKEEDFMEAIEAVQESIDKYNPSVLNFKWDTENPRIQLEPVGSRGYIELMPVTKI